jgi:hypothetical protein
MCQPEFSISGDHTAAVRFALVASFAFFYFIVFENFSANFIQFKTQININILIRKNNCSFYDVGDTNSYIWRLKATQNRRKCFGSKKHSHGHETMKAIYFSNPLPVDESSFLEHKFGNLQQKALMKHAMEFIAKDDLLPRLKRMQKRQLFGSLYWFKDNLSLIKSILSKREINEDLFHVCGDLNEFCF